MIAIIINYYWYYLHYCLVDWILHTMPCFPPSLVETGMEGKEETAL